MMVHGRSEVGGHIVERRREAGEIRLLRQIAHGQPRLDEALARIRLDESGRDLQERRLAGAVAADQRQAVAARHGELRAFEQRRAAEGQVNVTQAEDGWVHDTRYGPVGYRLEDCGLQGRIGPRP
jgi:hypothetical protein